ncbi:MAG: hypothetical protein IPO78_10365 [Saprospiraceae bacterium]|nr:hypothetical protein [Saprospiraceae bacterium]
MKQQKKKIEEYLTGDVIRGTFYTKNINHKSREHTLMVLNEVRRLSESKPHIPCLPSCSFSSKLPTNNKLPALILSGYNVPSDFLTIINQLHFSDFQSRFI